MEILKSIIFFTIFIISIRSFAYQPEEGRVTATLGPYVNRTNYDGPNPGAVASYLGGMNLTAVGDISDHGALEIALIYSPQIFFREEGGKFLVEKAQIIHVTMGYRWWHSTYFSTSLAFFSAYPTGDVEIIHSDFAQPLQIDTSARDPVKYGIDGAAQLAVWEQDPYAVVVEARYSYSITSKKSEHSDQYGILVGLRYTVQEEKNVEKRQKP